MLKKLLVSSILAFSVCGICLNASSDTNVSKQETDKKAYEILKKLPEKNFVYLKSPKDTNATMYLVTDPECPYCKDELLEIKEKLKNENVKIFIAPVHGDSAFEKGAFILEEAQKRKPEEREEILDIFSTYYNPDIKLNKKANQEYKKMIQENASKIFPTVKSVPFSFIVVE